MGENDIKICIYQNNVEKINNNNVMWDIYNKNDKNISKMKKKLNEISMFSHT